MGTFKNQIKNGEIVLAIHSNKSHDSVITLELKNSLTIDLSITQALKLIKMIADAISWKDIVNEHP